MSGAVRKARGRPEVTRTPRRTEHRARGWLGKGARPEPRAWVTGSSGGGQGFLMFGSEQLSRGDGAKRGNARDARAALQESGRRWRGGGIERVVH